MNLSSSNSEIKCHLTLICLDFPGHPSPFAIMCNTDMLSQRTNAVSPDGATPIDCNNLLRGINFFIPSTNATISLSVEDKVTTF